MNARIISFELPPDWEQPRAAELEKRRRHSKQRKGRAKSHVILTGEQIVAARKQQGLSQRELARRTGKSQSWIRDIENGRFRAKTEDQVLLRRVLEL
jgi:ribosome-binding protein aMBF1 (putative translation factor)